jgi:polar amino acid transport system substrate-binding protein/glutamine transport system substrate-binding protein
VFVLNKKGEPLMKNRVLTKLCSAVMAAALALSFTACGETPAGSSSVGGASSAGSSSAAGGSAVTGSVDGSMKGVTIKVGTSGVFGPFSYYDKDGKTLIGFDLDLIKALQAKLGFTIDGDIQAMSYSALGASIGQGKLDMAAAALCQTDERKKTMDFSKTYSDSGLKILINKTKNSGIKSVNDLHGKKVAVEKGTASHAYASKNLADATLEVHDTITTAYASLEQGKVDAVIQDLPNCAFYIKTNPKTNLEVVGDQFNQGQSPYAIAFKKGFAYTDKFNAALDELTKDGTMKKLDEKWCE